MFFRAKTFSAGGGRPWMPCFPRGGGVHTLMWALSYAQEPRPLSVVLALAAQEGRAFHFLTTTGAALLLTPQIGSLLQPSGQVSGELTSLHLRLTGRKRHYPNRLMRPRRRPSAALVPESRQGKARCGCQRGGGTPARWLWVRHPLHVTPPASSGLMNTLADLPGQRSPRMSEQGLSLNSPT